jgi:flagella synthesis protein FlgN
MSLTTDVITALLSQQQQHLDELLSLLRQELAALASRDITLLEQITVAKTSVLQQLQHTDQQLAQVGELDSRLEQCKRHNDINQQTLEQSQLTLARFKTELLTSRGKSGLTYTNKGKPAVENKGKGIKA